MARRAANEQRPSTALGPNAERKIAGQIVGELLQAITFGALDGPQSARAPEPTSGAA
ncbi:MAG TPA: hypothetical protein VLT33_07675 [Labilithrix sp.]|nr:hypothetical protein [Labilithrix sp.]